MALPLPGISTEKNVVIKELIGDSIQRKNDEYLQKYINKKIFRLSENEVEYINGFVERNNRHFHNYSLFSSATLPEYLEG